MSCPFIHARLKGTALLFCEDIFPKPVSMGFHGGFHAQLIRCHVSFLHETGRREKGFVSWPRNLSALFPKLRKHRETCTEALPSFHRDFSSPGPCVLHRDSAGRGRRTVAGEAARRARSSAGRGRSAGTGGSSAGCGRRTAAGEVAGHGCSSASRGRSAGAGGSSAGRGRWTAVGARPPVAGDPPAPFVVSRPSRLRPPHVLRQAQSPPVAGAASARAPPARRHARPPLHARPPGGDEKDAGKRGMIGIGGTHE